MSDYSEEQAKFKAVKRGIVEQRPLPNKNKRERPVELEYRTEFKQLSFLNHDWKTYSHRYRTVEEAEMAVKQLNRKYFSWSEYRIKEKP